MHDKISENLYKLEEVLLEAWHITDDLQVTYEYFYEEPKIDNDKLAHILLGLKELQNARLNKAFNIYEDIIKLYHDQKQRLP